MVSAGSFPKFAAAAVVSASTMDAAGAESSAGKPAFGAASVMEKCVSSVILKPSRESASPYIPASPPAISSGISVLSFAIFSSRSKLYCTSDAVSALPLENTTPSRRVKS